MHSSKSDIRSLLKTLLRENRPYTEQKSLQLCREIQKHPDWIAAKTVALFAPLPGEPNLLHLCPNSGKRLFFPKISDLNLRWLEVEDTQTQLSRSPNETMHLLEPITKTSIELSEIHLMLIPGLAFTKSGHRLGRGGGFYDRALSQRTLETKVMGVCFDFQIREILPTDPHDQPVDGLFYI
ncbi:MAG: 5-formyltetrahydrofolate cyclo-ligase [Verrucomicrobiota bacterium]